MTTEEKLSIISVLVMTEVNVETKGEKVMTQ
jgi:hypothetical protein